MKCKVCGEEIHEHEIYNDWYNCIKCVRNFDLETDAVKVFEAQGGYGRTIEVELMTANCFECKEKKRLLVLDNSCSEYTPMRFCIECLAKFSHGFISKSTWFNNNLDKG